MPSDDGSDVTDERGSVIGTRGYTRMNGSEYIPVTHYKDGSQDIHCGGPCGDLYVDKYGNT